MEYLNSLAHNGEGKYAPGYTATQLFVHSNTIKKQCHTGHSFIPHYTTSLKPRSLCISASLLYLLCGFYTVIN